MSLNDTKTITSRIFRKINISFVLLIVLFIAKLALASDSVKTFQSDSIKIREPDNTGVNKTDSFEPNLVIYIKADTTRYLTSDTNKVHRTDPGTAKTNLKLNKSHKKTIGEDLLNDGGILFKDWGRYLTVPLRMKGTDWLVAGAVIGGTVISSFADSWIHKNISVRDDGSASYKFYDNFSKYGYVYYQVAFAGGLYLTGLFARSDDVRETGRMILQSLTYGGTLTIGLRYLFGRERPYVTDDPYKFDPFKTKSLDTQSFP